MASKKAIARVTREIFGQMPQKNVRTGHSILRKTQTGPYLKRYFLDPIEPHARKAMPPDMRYTSELEQRRLDKLDLLRRRGKGPPKKGSGKRASKK